MAMQSSTVILILFIVLAAPMLIDASRFKRGSPTVPGYDLPTQSDSKFMKKDLPSDERPGAGYLKFGHPYPAVQEHAEYDEDFVKDENKDDGSWKAQSEYDMLRQKVRKELKEMMAAKVNMEEEKRELDQAKDQAGMAKKDAADAKNDHAAASGKLSDAEKKRAAAAGAESRANGRAANATAEKDCSETAGLCDALATQATKEKKVAECQGELDVAKKRVKELKDKEVAKKQAALDAADGDARASAAERKEYEKQKAAADAEQMAAAKKAGAASAKEADTIKTVDQEQAEYDKAKAEYEKQNAQYEQAMKDLKAAEDRLNDNRRAIDKKGAVYNEPEKKKTESKSGAARSSAAVLAILAASAAAFVA